ncbi:hypothetical protein PDTK01_23140 [Phycicoccus sp. DTK01]|nr:hypothetical protein PDTK01_23140 [Phycicoccus sp. DTK01]
MSFFQRVDVPALALRGGRDSGILSRAVVCDNRNGQDRPRVSSRWAPHGRGVTMSKRARKRRSRKGNKANHGRKPNA